MTEEPETPKRATKAEYERLAAFMRVSIGRLATSATYGSDYPAAWMKHLNRPHSLKGD